VNISASALAVIAFAVIALVLLFAFVI